MYTHLLLISTVQIPRAYCSFFYYNIFIVSEQVFLRFFMNLSRHARICNSSHHLQKATEKVLFAYKLAQNKVHQSTLRYYIQYTKTVFQWRPYRGEGILATVVKYILAAHLSGHQWCQGKSPEYFICIFVFQINRLGASLFVKYSPLLYAHFIRKYHNLPDNNYE